MFTYLIRTKDTGTVWDIITSDVREPLAVIFEDWCAYRRAVLDDSREPYDRFEISEISEHRSTTIEDLRLMTRSFEMSIAVKVEA